MVETDNNTKGNKRNTYALAVWSFVLAVIPILYIVFIIGLISIYGSIAEPPCFLFVLFFCLPVSFVFGIISFIKIWRSKSQSKGYIFSALGVILSLATVLTCFIAIAVSRSDAKIIVCRVQLMQIGEGMHIYANNNNGKYPTADKWCDLLLESDNNISEGAFRCPSAKGGRCHYAMNPKCEPNSPPDTVLLFEAKDGWNQFGGAELITVENHKGAGCNVLFNNKLVSWINSEEIPDLNWGEEK